MTLVTIERPPNETQAGLDWYGDRRGSNTLTGWFAVDSVTYANDALTGIDLRFELHSEGAAPALHGVCQHYVSGHWLNKLAVESHATNYTGYTKCSARIRLKTKDRGAAAPSVLRIRSTPHVSGWRSVKVG